MAAHLARAYFSTKVLATLCVFCVRFLRACGFCVYYINNKTFYNNLIFFFLYKDITKTKHNIVSFLNHIMQITQTRKSKKRTQKTRTGQAFTTCSSAPPRMKFGVVGRAWNCYFVIEDMDG